jgi:hypothetical protein
MARLAGMALPGENDAANWSRVMCSCLRSTFWLRPTDSASWLSSSICSLPLDWIWPSARDAIGNTSLMLRPEAADESPSAFTNGSTCLTLTPYARSCCAPLPVVSGSSTGDLSASACNWRMKLRALRADPRNVVNAMR